MAESQDDGELVEHLNVDNIGRTSTKVGEIYQV